MTTFVDTNILIRHLTGDPPDMADRATRFLAASEQLVLTDLIVAETVHVLESVYKATREKVAKAVGSMLAFESVICVHSSVICVHSSVITRALQIFESYRIDFPEAYLVACAELTGSGVIASFDRSIDRVPSVIRLAPT